MKPNWITLDKTSGTEGVETVNISAMGNMGEERKSQMVAKTADGAEATLNIAQAGVPIVGAVRIEQDLSPEVINITFKQNYEISYPEIQYMPIPLGDRTAKFTAMFNIDAKYLHDVVNYLADTYPDDWNRKPYLFLRWTSYLGQDAVLYTATIPETGRILLTTRPPSEDDLYTAEGSEISVSVAGGAESIYVDLYKIRFSSL